MSLLESLNKELDEKRLYYEKKKSQCSMSLVQFEKSILNAVSKQKDETHFHFAIQEGCGSEVRDYLRKNKLEPWVPGSINMAKKVTISFNIEKNYIQATLL